MGFASLLAAHDRRLWIDWHQSDHLLEEPLQAQFRGRTSRM